MDRTLPFYLVPLSHPHWDQALVWSRRLPPEALPEVRLDLFPDEDPARLVQDLRRRCLVSCRRPEDGGAWKGTEHERLAHLERAAEERPAWLDLEWNVDVPPAIRHHALHIRILRSRHAPAGVFDLPELLEELPPGDAYAWTGEARELAANGGLRAALGWARDRNLRLGAFLRGPKGLVGRCMQGAWGGAFTYAAPDNAPPAEPGLLPLARMREWRCHKLNRETALCAHFGMAGPAGPGLETAVFMNESFQRAFKDLLFLPLVCDEPREAAQALDTLGLLGVLADPGLLPALREHLGLAGPLDTLWRRALNQDWSGCDARAEALRHHLKPLAAGPVLLVGGEGMAWSSTLETLSALDWPVLAHSSRAPLDPGRIGRERPIGAIQAVDPGSPVEESLPCPHLLEAAGGHLRWAVDWALEPTPFSAWAHQAGLTQVDGPALALETRLIQAHRFTEGCGG